MNSGEQVSKRLLSYLQIPVKPDEGVRWGKGKGERGGMERNTELYFKGSGLDVESFKFTPSSMRDYCRKT